MARRRGGHHAAELHVDAMRLLAETDYPSPVKQVILMALRGGKPGKQVCVVCQKAAQHCQLWVPPALTQACPTRPPSPPSTGCVMPTMARCQTPRSSRSSPSSTGAARGNDESVRA